MDVTNLLRSVRVDLFYAFSNIARIHTGVLYRFYREKKKALVGSAVKGGIRQPGCGLVRLRSSKTTPRSLDL